MPVNKLMKILEPSFDKNDPLSFSFTDLYITTSVGVNS